MAKCRFFPECARCNEVGDSWFPCEGGADGTRCADYAPMPDVEALLELAEGLDCKADDIIRAANHAQFSGLGPSMGEAKHDAYEWRCIARCIREACGEVDE